MGFGMDHEWGWKPKFNDYESALAFLNGGRRKTERPVEWKTRIYLYDDGRIGIRYHETDVVIYHPDGSVELNSGGWKTLTTKRRINSYVEWPENTYGWKTDLYTDGGIWYVKWGDARHVFQDEMKLLPDGSVNYGRFLPPNILEIKDLRKRINKYASDFVKNLNGLGQPDDGDCWHCRMGIGDKFNDTSHLVSHMEDGYYVPSLVTNALEEANYGDMWGYELMYTLAGSDRMFFKGDDRYFNTTIRKVIRKYMQKRFGLSVG